MLERRGEVLRLLAVLRLLGTEADSSLAGHGVRTESALSRRCTFCGLSIRGGQKRLQERVEDLDG